MEGTSYDWPHLRALASTPANITGDCEVVGNVFDIHGCECAEDARAAESMKVVLAIIVHVVGSVGINTGQNLQAMGLQRLAEEDRQTCSKLVRSKLWAIGCSLFITSSIVNFLALTLAPASILVPLEAVQFICNVAFGKFVRKLIIPWRMYGGVGLMCFGVFLAVFFGERGSFCFTEDDLKEKWTFEHGWGWWIYIAITFSFSVVCILAHRKCWAMRKAGKPYPNAQLIMPVLYAVPSSLLGGGQMIVQSKVLSEMLEISIQGPNEYHIDYVIPLAGWFFWVTLLLVSVMGMFWFFRLTQSLGLYEPLFIIPLMQASFIVFGGIAVSSQQIRRGTPPAAAAAHTSFFIHRDTPSPPSFLLSPTHFCTYRLSPVPPPSAVVQGRHLLPRVQIPPQGDRRRRVGMGLLPRRPGHDHLRPLFSAPDARDVPK